MLPLVFEPYLRPLVWGGRALGKKFGKHLPDMSNYGESWELSGHPDHITIVKEGPYAGQGLSELVRDHWEELFGAGVPKQDRFPLLIKLLDCNELLSVQVHPDDEAAARILGNERGKTEAWIVLEVSENGRIYAGLKEGVTKEELANRIEAGNIADCLHSFVPKRGDCVFLPAGLVHAVGGVIFAEVQQTSDATFRLFDWNRTGTDGKPRQLHIRESLETIDFSLPPGKPVTPELVAQDRFEQERLVECSHFSLHRYRTMEGTIPCGSGELEIWMVLEGDGELEGDEYKHAFHPGETVLIPATAGPHAWRNKNADRQVVLIRTIPVVA